MTENRTSALMSPFVTDPTIPTLTNFIFTEEYEHMTATGELTELLNTFQLIAKTINAAINSMGLSLLYGVGHNQKDTDKFYNLASEIFLTILSSSTGVRVILPHESKKVVEVKKSRGKYLVAYDPVNGISNMDVAVTIGSIFSIMSKKDDSLPSAEDALNPDNRLVCAGYILYGTATIFVFTTGETVNEFVLDPQIGEFLLAEKNVKIPKKGAIFSINQGYCSLWDDGVKAYVNEKMCSEKKKPSHGRYVGSMAADVHRILKQGGIYMYPANKEKATGNLRLIQECKPIAFIITAAGGLAMDGFRPILEITPRDLLQRSPLFIGSRDDVQELMQIIHK